MFTRQEREQIRAALVSAAQADSKVTGAAHLGSAAAGRLDDWSDIDLALCLSPDAALDEVIAAWTARLYEDHGAVAHCDVQKRRDALPRFPLAQHTASGYQLLACGPVQGHGTEIQAHLWERERAAAPACRQHSRTDRTSMALRLARTLLDCATPPPSGRIHVKQHAKSGYCIGMPSTGFFHHRRQRL
jgi:hypothetical protein